MHPGLAGDDDSIDVPGLGLGSIRANAEVFRARWPSTARVYMPGGELPRSGDLIRNPALANLFRRLLDAEAGARGGGREAGLRAAVDRFYRGDIARDIVAHSDAHGGLLALEDLAAFTTRIEEPVEPHLSRRNRLQVRTVVAGAGLPPTARAAGGLRPRLDGA